jgi:hypothetical protein
MMNVEKFYLVKHEEGRWSFVGNVPIPLMNEMYHSRQDAEDAAFANGYPWIERATMVTFYGRDVLGIAYPGQSESVRVGIGVTCWVAEVDGRVRSPSLTWQDKPYPDATHSAAEFERLFGAGIR